MPLTPEELTFVTEVLEDYQRHLLHMRCKNINGIAIQELQQQYEYVAQIVTKLKDTQ